MIINASSLSNYLLLPFTLHDYIFENIQYDYSDNILIITVSPEIPNGEKVYIKCCNVIAFTMISCDFLGKSPHILDWTILSSDKSSIVKELNKEKVSNNYLYSRLRNDQIFLEAFIEFISGDQLAIVCECIEINKTEDRGRFSVLTDDSLSN